MVSLTLGRRNVNIEEAESQSCMRKIRVWKTCIDGLLVPLLLSRTLQFHRNGSVICDEGTADQRPVLHLRDLTNVTGYTVSFTVSADVTSK